VHFTTFCEFDSCCGYLHLVKLYIISLSLTFVRYTVESVYSSLLLHSSDMRLSPDTPVCHYIRQICGCVRILQFVTYIRQICGWVRIPQFVITFVRYAVESGYSSLSLHSSDMRLCSDTPVWHLHSSDMRLCPDTLVCILHSETNFSIETQPHI
jgi:hypothetical protein